MEIVELPPEAPPPVDVGPELRFAEVPSAERSAVVDPVWLAHRTGSGLPESYLPPVAPGALSRSPWPRVVALLLIGIFLTATAAGVCLTYGPPSLRP